MEINKWQCFVFWNLYFFPESFGISYRSRNRLENKSRFHSRSLLPRRFLLMVWRWISFARHPQSLSAATSSKERRKEVRSIMKMRISKAELPHAIYACRTRMHFQCKPGQTKVVFNNQGKNALQWVVFWIGFFLFKIEIACYKKLKQDV